MPTYRIEGKRVKTEKPLSDAEIDEIGAQIRGAAPAPVAAAKPAAAPSSGVPVGRMGVGAEAAPAMALLSPEQKRQALEVGAQVAALGAGGVIGGAIRGVGALLPRVAPYVEPLAAAVETGGFRSGLSATAPKSAQIAMRGAGGAIAGAGGAAVVNPEDAGYGAMIGAAVPVVGAPLLARGASMIGAGIDRLAGLSPTVRAGRMVRATAGDQLNALRAAMQTNPDRPAAELASELNLPLFQALVQKAESKDPFTTNVLLRQREGEDLLNQLRNVAGGATQTEMRAGREAAAETLNKITSPMREDVLRAAGTAGKIQPKLEAKAAGYRKAASDAVQDFRRFSEAGDRALEWAKDWAPGGARQPGALRGPTKFTYPGELAGRAENVAGQAADRSLQYGEIARDAEARLASLEASGLKPLKTDTMIASLKAKLKDPEIATNREANAAVSRVAEMLQDWTNRFGVITPEALYAIRKNGVSGVIRDLNPAMDEKAQRKFAAQVMSNIRPLIDDSIERASGSSTMWKNYLKTFEEGKSGISRKELTAQLTDLFENNKSAFEKIVRGDNPDAVETILGPGKYDISQELISEMPALRKAAESIRTGERISEQAKMGKAALAEQQGRDRWFKRFPFFTRASTAINEVGAALEAKTKDKTMDVLIEAAKSGRKMQEVMDMLPAAERVKVLQVIRTPAQWNKWVSGIATSYAGSQGAEAPVNRMAPSNQNALAQ
jgi:hypothetical protein